MGHWCGAEWTGARTAHCGGCHATFSSDSAFDQHRLDLTCLDPAERGLIQRPDGLWRWPGSSPFAIERAS